jgi:small GTP-binding protein
MGAWSTQVLVGLDNAGKSTMLLALQGESTDNVTTTWGFARESLVDGACKLDIYDLGGGKNIRKIWERYYAEVHGVLFCVDAADKERLEEAKGELHAMVGVSHVAGKAVLIFANKQDLPHAMGVAEVAAALDLASIPNLRYQVRSIRAPFCCGLSRGGSTRDAYTLRSITTAEV